MSKLSRSKFHQRFLKRSTQRVHYTSLKDRRAADFPCDRSRLSICDGLMELTIVAIVLLGLFFDYTNGFHDAANVVATVIATRALAPLSAIVMAGVLNFIGALQISGVAQTISSGLVRPDDATQVVVLCAVVGAIFWNLLTWYYGLPSSSSYALIGGLIGSA